MLSTDYSHVGNFTGYMGRVFALVVAGPPAQRVLDLPAGNGLLIKKGDAVFCKVGGRLMLHLVTAYRAGQYQISNAKGWVNGWTPAKNIYGVLVGVEP